MTRTINRLLALALALTLSAPTLLFAQDTPGTVRYPTALDTADSLIRAANSARTTLSASITNNAATISVASTASFPASGAFMIDSEIIFYTGKTATTFTGLVRGADGTTAAAHSSGAAVRGVITAAHHNTLANAIIAMQSRMGTGASTPTAGTVLRGTGAGASSWSALTSAELPASPSFSGTVTAGAFVGNGAGLTGVTGATGGVSNTGSTTIGADTDADDVGIIDLQTRNETRVRVGNDGVVDFYEGLRARRVNGVRVAAEFPGANFGERVEAALADCPAAGGCTIDARSLTGAQSLSTSLTISKPNVRLLLGPVVLTMGTNQLTVDAGTHGVEIVGSSPWGGQPISGAVLTGTVLSYTGSGVAVLVGDNTQHTQNFALRDLAVVANNAGANVVGIRLYSTLMARLDRVRSLNNHPAPVGAGIEIRSGTGDHNYSAYNLLFQCVMDNWTRGIALVSESATFQTNVNQIIGGRIASFGPALETYGIDIQAGLSNTIADIDIENVTVGVKIASHSNTGRNITFEGVGTSGTTLAGNAVLLTETATGNRIEFNIVNPGPTVFVSDLNPGKANSTSFVAYDASDASLIITRTGFGTVSPEARAHVYAGGGEYGLTVGQQNSGANVRYSLNGVQAFNNNAASRLLLNPEGGAVVFRAPASINAASILSASTCSFVLDEVSNRVRIYCLYADGTTVRVGEITLTAP